MDGEKGVEGYEKEKNFFKEGQNGNSLIVSRSFVGSYSNGGLVCVYQGVSSEVGTNDGSRLAFTGNVIEEKNTETFKSLTAIG